MPEKKRQHYVPKLYMKGFSKDGKKFAVLNVKNKEVYPQVPYDQQCYADYFYGEDKVWEDRFGEMETCWIKVFERIRNKSALSSSDIQRIKEFAVFQRQRTLAEIEYINTEQKEFIIELGKSVAAKRNLRFGESSKKVCIQCAKERAVKPSQHLTLIESLVSVVSDLELVIINYETKERLISSDVPIIMINPFCPPQIGMVCMGLIVLFPVSPKQLVVLYDAKMYPRYKGKTYVSLCNENEVHNLNILQLISAEKILFAYDKDDLSNFKQHEYNCRDKNRSVDTTSSIGPYDKRLTMFSPRKTIFDCSFSFGKIRSDFEAVPKQCREAVPRIWDKNWENKLRMAGDVIRQVTKLTGKVPTSLLSPKKVYKGREQMFKCALKYWRQ